jgi:hypothetical protein
MAIGWEFQGRETMTGHGFFFRLAQRFTPRAWLALAMLMAVLALGSAWVLYLRLSDSHKDRVVLAYESIGGFVRETWRLTVERDKPTVATVSDAVRVAPVGTLDPEVTFAAVTQFKDFESLPETDALPAPVAPLRVLDPHWNPSFSYR